MQRQRHPAPPPATRARRTSPGRPGAWSQGDGRRGSRSGVPPVATGGRDCLPFTVTEHARVLEPVTRDPFVDG